jgi:hypothetical protein
VYNFFILYTLAVSVKYPRLPKISPQNQLTTSPKIRIVPLEEKKPDECMGGLLAVAERRGTYYSPKRRLEETD